MPAEITRDEVEQQALAFGDRRLVFEYGYNPGWGAFKNGHGLGHFCDLGNHLNAC